jgi:serine protease Do
MRAKPKRSSAVAVRLPAIAACVALLAAPLAGQARPKSEPATTSLRQFGNAVEALARRVSPSVVQVLVTAIGSGRGPERTGILERQRVIGSGVIVDSGGFVVTNAHVVSGAQRVRVALTVGPAAEGAGARPLMGPVVDARVVGVDVETDIAVLKVDTTGLAAMPFGDSDRLHKGELVFAFGSPVGLANSVTMGVISAVAREIEPERPVVYIQTDATINPGNSGGPLVDADGALVGINTFILSQSGGSEGLGFAIPSDIVQFVYRELRTKGRVHRGIIGIKAQEITPVLATGLGLSRNWGLLLADVAPGGPAEASGLAIGDVVMALNGQRVGSLAEFVANLTLRNVGRTVRLDVQRGAQHLALDIPVVERRDSLDRLMAIVDPEKNLVRRIGIVGFPIDATVVGLIPGLRLPSGVLVLAQARYAGSAESGAMPGDVIHALNRAPVTSLADLRSAVRDLKAGDAAVLQIERQGVFQFLPFEIE